jgi:hypothetical protein
VSFVVKEHINMSKKSKQLDQSSNKEQQIDFTGLPVKEVSVLLRRIATGLLSELLDTSASPGKPVQATPQPDLVKFLLKDQVLEIGNSYTWKLKRKGPGKRIPKTMREELPRAMRKLVSKTRMGKIKPRQWEIAANNRIALALGGTIGGGLPDDLWQIAAQWAWNDPAFKLSISLKIHEWLRNMRLLVPYEPPTISFSPNSFWLLISLARIKPMRLSQWFSKKERTRVRLGRRLQEEAKAQTMKNQWACFWDQWLIQTATQRWPKGFKQLDSRLCKALVALPLLKISSGSSLCRGKKSLAPPLEKLMEKLFDRIDGIRRLKRPAKDFRRAVLLNISTTDWELYIPQFFSNMKNSKINEQ